MQTDWKCCLSLNSPLIFTDFKFAKYNNTTKIFITSQAYVRSIIKHHWILNSLLSYIPWFTFRTTITFFSSLEWCFNGFSCIGKIFQASQSALASHARVFRGSRFSFLPTNACSTENNIPFPLFYLCGKWPVKRLCEIKCWQAKDD